QPSEHLPHQIVEGDALQPTFPAVPVLHRLAALRSRTPLPLPKRDLPAPARLLPTHPPPRRLPPHPLASATRYADHSPDRRLTPRIPRTCAASPTPSPSPAPLPPEAPARSVPRSLPRGSPSSD